MRAYKRKKITAGGKNLKQERKKKIRSFDHKKKDRKTEEDKVRVRERMRQMVRVEKEKEILKMKEK